MFNPRKHPLPETTEECKRLLRILEEKVKKARPSPFMQSESEFRPNLQMLYKNRCKQALSWFIEEHMNAPTIFEQRLVKMATEYRERL